MKWCRIKAFIVSGIKTTFREKSSIFWVFVWPIILTFMVAYVFIPPSVGQPVTLDLGVVNLDHSESPFNGTAFIDVLKDIEYNGTKLFNVKLYDNETKLVDDLRKGRLGAGIVIPDGFGENITFAQAKLVVYVSGGDIYSIQVNRAVLSEFLHAFSVNVGLKKIEMTMKYMNMSYTNMSYVPANMTAQVPWSNKSLIEFLEDYFKGLVLPVNSTIIEETPEALSDRPSIVGWFVLGALGMMMLYSGFLVGAVAVVEEKERGSLERILSTPATETDMLIGKTISGLIVLTLSSIAIIITGVFVAGAKITWNPLEITDWLVPLNLLLIGLMTIGIGLVLSLLSKTSSGASSMATILGLFFAFTAGIWFPREWMPGPMRILADIFPVTWALDTIRDIVIYNIEFNEAMVNTIRSIIVTIIIFAAGIMAYKKAVRKYIEQ